MTLEEALQHALDGNAVLFLGAGFSYGALNQDHKPIPSGQALARKLLDDIGYKAAELPLDKASAAYLRRAEPRQLVEVLVKEFSVASVSDAHRAIAALPWRRVYTTNYDEVFEQARREAGISFTSVEGADEPRPYLSRSNLVVHLNGLVSRLVPDGLSQSFKLTSGSYATDSFESSGWAFHFRNDVRLCRAVIFVGYSMYDLDIRRAIFQEDISERCVFITAPISSQNELEAEDLADLGVLLPIGVDALGAKVSEIVEVYEPRDEEMLLESWMRVAAVDCVERSTDQEVIQFLEDGCVASSLLFEAIGSDAPSSSIPRDARDMAHHVLRQRTPLVITGELGAGKSFLVQVLSQMLLRDGYDVFSLISPDYALEELQDICSIGGSKLIIIENYHRNLQLLRWISEFAPKDVSILLTARASSHDLAQGEIANLFPEFNVLEIAPLSPTEVSGAASLMTQYGLWGERSNWPHQRKVSYVSHDCSSSLPSLLVEIMRARHITERYRDLIQAGGNSYDVKRALVCIFALEVMSFIPETHIIQELLSNSVNWGGLRANAGLKSVVNFGAGVVRVRSSVLAHHLLRTAFDSRTVIDALATMARNASENRGSRQYSLILNDLMRFSNVSAMLPEERKLASTVAYYEAIKNLESARRNPQFWLQYAIGCLALGRLERAERYFQASYKFAGDGYDTAKIDNHYARFLIERALSLPSFEEAKRDVDRASSIVLMQMAGEVKFYPYRVAEKLFTFFEKRKSEFGPADRQSFRRTLMEVKKRAEATSGALRKNRYVEECILRASRALEELG